MSVSEFDYLLKDVLKLIDSPNKMVHHSFASLIASLLVLSQEKKYVPPKKSKDHNPPERNILTVDEMLSFLPNYYVKAHSADARVTIIEAFAIIFRYFGIQFAEQNYSSICTICFELSANPKLQQFKLDYYAAKASTGFLLREVVGKLLSEAGQLRACRDLAKRLKGWIPGSTELSDTAICGILNELGHLLEELGPAAYSIQDDIVDPMMNLMQHPSFLVKLELATCLRDFCLALPQHITKIMNKLVISIQKDLGAMTAEKNESIEKIIGYSQILSSIIGIISSKPLFAAYEDAATIFGLATQLLKSHTSVKDYRVMASQAQIGWTLIGSLMTLGPNFVRVHVSQLLLMWKNVFPKVQPKDGSVNRTELEWGYLLYSRDAALVALLAFIQYNAKELITTDVSKRIMVCLHNVLQFLATLPGAYGPLDDKPPTPIQFKLYDRECLLKQRLYQCFQLLQPTSVYEAIYIPILKSLVDTFALDPEKADRFTATLGQKDGALFGTIGGRDTGALFIESVHPTSLAFGNTLRVAEQSGAEDRSISKVSIKDSQSHALDSIAEQSVYISVENDPNCLYLVPKMEKSEGSLRNDALPVEPPVTSNIGVVNAAIELFALLFPIQNAQTQETLVEQLVKAATFQGGRITPIRKASCQLNALVAIVGSLKYIAAKKGQLASPKVAVGIRELIIGFVESSDLKLRTAACEIVGRLCRVSGNAQFVNPLIQELVDKVVSNRGPYARSGACLALGSIYNFVGGMAAGSHLKTCVGIFHSLASDPHPHVHTWALHSLWLTIESAGLMYGPFVNSTLSLIAKLYMSDSHEIAAPAANTQDSDSNVEVYPALGRILHALVGVIGPELQDSPKLRDICFNLFEQLKNDSDPFVVVEAIRCIQNFIMFAPKHIDLPSIIPFLQSKLIFDSKNPISVVRTAAITCLYQLSQKDASSVLMASVNNCLEEQLFSLLDLESDSSVRDEIRDVLRSLLRFTVLQSPSRWIDLCKDILNKSGPPTEKVETVTPKQEVQEEFEDGENDIASTPIPKKAEHSTTAAPIFVSLVPRWRTHVFALSCLELVIDVVLSKAEKHDVYLDVAKSKKLALQQQGSNTDFLVFRLGDLVRLAFNSSTAAVSFLRLAGLRLLKKVLENYGGVPDPDFEGHSLLEQYEAQITSAIAPGFEPDSPPQITSAACHVCAYFLGSRILTDISLQSRPIRLLTTLLEQLMEQKMNGRTPNAQNVIKAAVLSAWAAFFLSIRDKSHRMDLFPNLPSLFQMWIELLGEYAVVRDMESQSECMASTFYGGATQDITSEALKESWIQIIAAVSEVLETSPKMLQRKNIDPSEQFYVLFGLCVEFAAATRESSANPVENHALQEKNIAHQQSVLNSLRKLLSYSRENLILDEPHVNELLQILDRSLQTEDPRIFPAIAELLKELRTIAPVFLGNNLPMIGNIVFNICARRIRYLSANSSSGSFGLSSHSKPRSHKGRDIGDY
jgi:hypothetical protein